jgi:hypothetical protein
MKLLHKNALCACCFTGAATIAAFQIYLFFAAREAAPYLVAAIGLTAAFSPLARALLTRESSWWKVATTGAGLALAATIGATTLLFVSGGEYSQLRFPTLIALALAVSIWFTIPLGICAAFLYRSLLRRFERKFPK